jgi:hypothetical protein
MNQDEKLIQCSEEETILKFFVCGHLPPKLREVSEPFGDIALMAIMRLLPRSAERTVALRKLLESKDAAVRAAL